MKFSALALVALMFLGVTANVDAGLQPPTRTFVKGAVTKSGKPVSSVWVVVSQGGRDRGRSLTGDDGKFYISNLDNGTYDIVVMKGSTRLFKAEVTLPKGSTFNIKL